MKARVCAVIEAGDVPGRNPLIPRLTAELAKHDLDLFTWDPTKVIELPPPSPRADLYLLKADDPAALSAAACLHDLGVRCLNSYPATEAAHDKARLHSRLARAGLPVPVTRLVGNRASLEATLEQGPLFVKPVRGAHGASAARLRPGEGSEAGFDPWLVQEVVSDTGLVVKVYGVKDHAAVRCMRFSPGAVEAPRLPFEDSDGTLVTLAARAAEAAELVCYGADFVLGPDGPRLVDLNAFPGYRGVPEAPAWIADAVLQALRKAR